MDSYSGSAIYYRYKLGGFISIGVDTSLVRAHALNWWVNKNFRKIEP
jgi:hypothetical protein